MKKLFIALMCFGVLNCMPTFANGVPIIQGVTEIDDKPLIPDNGKAPVRIPTIYLDGHTLSFSPSHSDYHMNIVHNNEVIYSSIIPSGITNFELPNYLNGEYMIQFIRGNFCFYGIIDL